VCSPACRPHAVWPRRQGARSVPTSVRALFWSKTGDWYEVDAALEAEAFLEGVPRGSTKLQLVAGPDGGFVRTRRPPREISLHRVDAALVCCHGGPGEDGTLQAALDLAGICYSGPTVAGAALGMDKLAFGRSSHRCRPAHPAPGPAGIPGADPPSFEGPFIVKPRFGGSSIGIDVVEDFATAEARLSANPHLRFGAVLEPYRPDLTDLQLGVRTWPSLEFSAVERPIRATELDRHPRLPRQVRGGRGHGRVPIVSFRPLSPLNWRKDCGTRRQRSQHSPTYAGSPASTSSPTVSSSSSTRSIPCPGSLARYLWVAPPLPFATILGDLLTEARQRPTHAYSAAGADGSVLRSAGSIAGKLG
jgi:D-alanine-D-alanine ligase